MQVKKERTGEARMMNCGMSATITEYVNAHNITIQFSDGTIVGPRSYDSFKKGIIGYPETRKIDRTEEEGVSNSGLKMKIINYRNSLDIDVQFEDGEIVRHKTYNNFKKGFIKHPKTKNTYAQRRRTDSEKKWTGAVRYTNRGEKITLVKYIDSKNVIVQFEDGTQVCTTSFNFDNGAVGYPKTHSQS